MELQQSDPYVKYMQALKWHTETIDGIHIYYRYFPIWGGFAKLQRFNTFPSVEKIKYFLKTKKIRKLVVESGQDLKQQEFYDYVGQLKPFVSVVTSPYLASKTLLLDLNLELPQLFKTFSEAKQRAVKRAIKNHIEVNETNSVEDLIYIKNKSAGLFGFITTSGLKNLWENFGTKHTRILLGYNSSHKQNEMLTSQEVSSKLYEKTPSLLTINDQVSTLPLGQKHIIVGGIFLIFWNQTAYYWIAGASKKGKKLFVPSLLVWEALKVSKAQGMKRFDFVGIWDDRFPKESRDWLGFTKFKQGFGGKEFYYPSHRINNYSTQTKAD